MLTWRVMTLMTEESMPLNAWLQTFGYIDAPPPKPKRVPHPKGRRP